MSQPAVKIAKISSKGILLLIHNKQLLMTYDNFPMFKDESAHAILNVQEVSPGHFYWPDIDIDLTEEIIEHPERFPLKPKT